MEELPFQARSAAVASISGSLPAEDAAVASGYQLHTTISQSCTNRGVAPQRETIGCVGSQPGMDPASALMQELVALCSGAVSEDFLLYALERKFYLNAEVGYWVVS